jgi:hypothetical protein
MKEKTNEEKEKKLNWLGQPFKPGYSVKPEICVMKVW